MTSAALFCQARGLAAAGATDQGRHATTNEDCYAISHDVALCVVADGVGGGTLGGAAAQVACDVVQERFHALAAASGGRGTCEDLWLADAVARANDRVHAMWPEGRTATTLVAAAFVGDRVIIAHVGDSRLYRLRGMTLTCLTLDHTHDGRLTRAVGVGPEVEVEVTSHRYEPGDRFLLCSDGLSGMLTSAGIAAAMLTQPYPEQAAQALVRAANRAGGHDNVTALVAHPDGGWMLRPHKPEPPTQLEERPTWTAAWA